MTQPAPRVHGHCDARFAAVRTAFEENFRDCDSAGGRGDRAAAPTGQSVVDLLGRLGRRGVTGLQRDAGRHLVDVQGPDRAVRAHPGRSRAARLRRPGGRVLAGVRGGGQGVRARTQIAVASAARGRAALSRTIWPS